MGSKGSSPLKEDDGEAARPTSRIEEVERGTPDWVEVERMVADRCEGYYSHYRSKSMTLEKLWRVVQGPDTQDILEKMKQNDMGKPMKLFHGTDVGSAEAIIQGGFQMPRSSGMFGKGLYFARCPLKSVGYANRGVSKGYAVKSMWRRFVKGEAEPSFMSKVMLLCDVYLGHQKTERCLMNVFSGSYHEANEATDIRPTLLDYMCCPHLAIAYCRRGFDSVYAPGGRIPCLNTVWVSEYVVFDPDQSIPLFLLEFETEAAPIPERVSSVRSMRNLNTQQSGKSLVGAPVKVASSKRENMEMKETKSAKSAKSSRWTLG